MVDPKARKKTKKEATPPANRSYKSPVGRPSRFTYEVVSKLETTFKMWANITEACAVAGITRECYYNNLRKFTELADKFEMARQFPTMTAKKNILKKVHEGDMSASQWWLIHYGDAKDKLEHTEEVGLSPENETIKFIEGISKELWETIIDAEIIDEKLVVKNTQ